jgi:hypothetical protein
MGSSGANGGRTSAKGLARAQRQKLSIDLDRASQQSPEESFKNQQDQMAL